MSPPTAARPRNSPSPHSVVSACGQLGTPGLVAPLSLLCGICAVAGPSGSCLPWSVHVVRAMNPCTQQALLNPVSGQPARQGLDVERRKPGHQVSFPT